MRKRLISLIMAIGIIASATACGSPTPPGFESLESHGEDVTVLSVYNFDGGVGDLWLENIKAKFEKKYENYSFEPGKKGVVIDPINGRGAIKEVVARGYDVIFSEEVYFNDAIASNLLLDISDVVTSSLSDVSDGKDNGTILNKLDESQKIALTAKDGNYYALPHYEVYAGLTYDADLFKDKALYISKTGGWTDDPSEMSCGPDGDFSATYDNGLPSSYEEFYKLMDKMVDMQVAPFAFAEQLPKYTNNLLAGLWASYSGKDEFLLNVNFDSEGTDTMARIMDFSTGSPVEKEVSINNENGYLMSQSAGKYYALEFLNKMVSKDEYISEKVTGSLSHTGAQEQFIFSNLEGKTLPIGMLIEGSYWYNEAKDHIARSENTYKEKARNRNFAWMPLPKQITGSVTEGHGAKNTLLEVLASFAVINANVKEKGLEECAKTFLKFCYSDEALANFTLDTGIPKGVKYTMSSTDLAKLPNYQRSLMELRAESEIIYPYSSNPIFVNHQNIFAYNQGSKVWESDAQLVAYVAFTQTTPMSVEDYFKGSAVSSDEWTNNYSKYF